MGFKKFLIFIATFFLVVFGVEFFSFLYLLNIDKQESFLIKKKKAPQVLGGMHKIYNTIDPLLGWSIDIDSLSSRNLKMEHGSVVLKSNKNDIPNPIKIYISGGSTSDIIFDSLNWPIFLLNKFTEKDIPVKIYIGSVAGYSSGQELLKTLRDIDKIKPDYHISYSGANEADNGSFVSSYEYDLYLSIFSKHFYGLLPNFKKVFINTNNNYKLINQIINDEFTFWSNNMSIMHTLSFKNNYKFIGVLQPVLSFGSDIANKNFDESFLKNQVEGFNKFYPKSVLHADSTSYILNYTDVFNYFSEELVFKDDCHLIDEKFQNIIANNIIKEIFKNEDDNINCKVI